MDLIKEAKRTCPKCGDPNLRDCKIMENNIEISGKLCPSCNWHDKLTNGGDCNV